jgi:hypothetical protein
LTAPAAPQRHEPQAIANTMNLEQAFAISRECPREWTVDQEESLDVKCLKAHSEYDFTARSSGRSSIFCWLRSDSRPMRERWNAL